MVSGLGELAKHSSRFECVEGKRRSSDESWQESNRDVLKISPMVLPREHLGCSGEQGTLAAPCCPWLERADTLLLLFSATSLLILGLL